MKRIICSFFLLTLLISFSSFSQETLTITTYYPAPFGVYKELRSRRMAVGENYFQRSSNPWEDDGDSSTTGINENADLVVEGNVGIGYTDPVARLHIVGSGNTIAPPTPSFFHIGLSEGLRIRQQNGYFGANPNFDAFIIERTDDDINSDNEGLVIGFANSGHMDTVHTDPDWATVHTPAIVMTMPTLGDVKVAIGHKNPQAKLDVDGGVKIGDDNDSCNPAKAGTVRYHGGQMQYCHANNWKSMVGGGETDLTCSPVHTTQSTFSDWASCPAPEKTVELFCMTRNIGGHSQAGLWQKEIIRSGYVANRVDPSATEIQCLFYDPKGRTGEIPAVKACARCLR